MLKQVATVHLRDWRRSDVDRVASVLDDPEILRWSHLAEVGPGGWIAEQQSGRRGPSLAVCELGDDRALGKVSLRLPGRASAATTCKAVISEDQPAGELSYWVVPDARGRGVATAAVMAMLDVARSLGRMRSVVLDIEVDNAASLRIAQCVGAHRREPTRVQHDRQGVARTLAVHVIAL
jgi:RimJ/RimL family protein N-acetyltransferase